MTGLQLQSILTCPKCGHQRTETMPTDACQYFYECPGCGALLRPAAGGLLRVLLVRHGAVPAGPGSPAGGRSGGGLPGAATAASPRS